jgi:hypothetical protein
MIELIKMSYVEANSGFATDVRGLLNEVFPNGAQTS